MSSRGLNIFAYLISSHGNKIRFMEKHETLIEARILFIAIYNPIMKYFDTYIDSVNMPSTYKDCKTVGNI